MVYKANQPEPYGLRLHIFAKMKRFSMVSVSGVFLTLFRLWRSRILMLTYETKVPFTVHMPSKNIVYNILMGNL